MRIKRWNEKSSSAWSNEVVFDLSRKHLDFVEGDLKNILSNLIEKRDIPGLVSFDLSPVLCTNAESMYHARQLLAFFQKRADVDIGVDCAAVAWEKFIASEAKCKESNEVFRRLHQGSFSLKPDVNSVLFRAQRKIADILGPVPTLQQLNLRFGPGATTQVKKKDSSVRRKLDQTFACSGELSQNVSYVLEEVPAWIDFGESETALCDVEIHYGKVEFVPKNAKTHRTICVEPMLNSLVQLGINDYLVQRLAAFGIDLKDQTLNQRLARQGSISGALATLDLSSASDCISIGLVADLLPIDWYTFLSCFRTGVVRVPNGGILTLEKFSSMGNGFTFPLESLIFYALAKACCADDRSAVVSVYGDDIIISQDYSLLLVDVLTTCGFDVNKSKSFFSGPFRESCGKDYFLGTDVRPCYIKDVLSGHSLFVLHNFYVRRGLPEFADAVLAHIDDSLRVWGPDGFGDGHLIGDCFLQPFKREHQWSGYTFETFSYRPRQAIYALGADYVYPAYSTYVSSEFSFPELHKRPVNLMFNRYRTMIHGDFRPPARGDRRYKGEAFTDSLPGVSGCRRVKVYTLTQS